MTEFSENKNIFENTEIDFFRIISAENQSPAIVK
jgi:hypothetical protein